MDGLASLFGFNPKTFPFTPQLRMLGATVAIMHVAMNVIGVYVLFRKAFGGLDDFDTAGATALAAVAIADAILLSALIFRAKATDD
jgi:hypothetical protein